MSPQRRCGEQAVEVETQHGVHPVSVAGNEAGDMGQMSNVCRIFNDHVGVRKHTAAALHSSVQINTLSTARRSNWRLARVEIHRCAQSAYKATDLM